MTLKEENILVNIIESLRNYEETSEALTKLMEINPNKTLLLAENILFNKKGDEYLQASAFDTLYSLNINRALAFAKKNINEIDVYLLGTVINNVTADSSIADDNIFIKDFVNDLKEYLFNRKTNELERIQNDIDWFNTTYQIGRV